MGLIRQYKDEKIYNNLKKANRLSFVSLIAFIVNIIIAIISIIMGSESLSSVGINIAIVNISVFVCIIYLIYNITSKVKAPSNYSMETKFFNDYANLIKTIIFSLAPLILLFFFSVFGLTRLVIDWAFCIGYMSIPYIFILIADSYLIYTCVLIKREVKKAPPQYILKEKLQKNHKYYNQLITLVGKKFFVKYYYKVRDLTFADAIDEVSEIYPYEEKKSRINALKKIFELKLEKFTLEQIVNSGKEISDDLKKSALELLNNEFLNK